MLVSVQNANAFTEASCNVVHGGALMNQQLLCDGLCEEKKTATGLDINPYGEVLVPTCLFFKRTTSVGLAGDALGDS